jgi:hypothetical protein
MQRTGRLTMLVGSFKFSLIIGFIALEGAGAAGGKKGGKKKGGK